jgi:hypothetical protein
MPQKTNLNIGPYYDDFDKNDNYYKVLFKPGFPIQARELTSLQSSLQNQIESFGSHLFKEGSMVIPGNINYDPEYYAVKINPQHLGIDVSFYINSLVGKKIRGQQSNITAVVDNYLLPSENDEIDDVTLYVKYLNSGNDNQFLPFTDGENLVAEEPIIYGNTGINSQETFASLIDVDATATGCAVGISSGVYFIRGSFVDVETDKLILDPYSNSPSYRVGLTILEDIVSAKEDIDLYDNAKGFSNYAAPGADRLKISTFLSKKLLTDSDDKSFVELIRVDNGEIKKLQNKSEYSTIRDYFAQRTYEESGDYAINKFGVELADCLNDGISNNGIYRQNQTTESGNIPSNDLMCVKVSPGKAYVRGYDVELVGTTIIDVEKPRDSEVIPSTFIPYNYNNLLKINNVNGSPLININSSNNLILLYKRRKTSNSSGPGSQYEIGRARVYSCSLANSSYSSNSTEWNLYLFDIQTYTQLELNESISPSNCPKTTYIQGLSSGASGYVLQQPSLGSVNITLIQTSGIFIDGEQISVNGSKDIIRSIKKATVYGLKDIKSIYQDTTSLGLPSDFTADTVLDKSIASGFNISDSITITTNGSNATVTSAGKNFSGISSDTIIRYQIPGSSLETYNRVSSVSSDNLSMIVQSVPNVSGVCTGALPTEPVTTTFHVGNPKVNFNNGSLYFELQNKNISSVDLNNCSVSIKSQIKNLSTDLDGVLSSSVSNAGITSSFFEPFGIEKYSISYSDGSIEDLTSDQVVISNNSSNITISGLKPLQNSNVTLNVSVTKTEVQSKIKQYVRSERLIIDKGILGIPTSSTGLSTSQYYGLRVQDKEISLNVPDAVNIVGVFESLDNDNPILDNLTFVNGLNLDINTVIGEKIIGSQSGAIAQLIRPISSTTVEFCYLNSIKFLDNESVTFEESNISSNIQSIGVGKYLNITDKFFLNKGQEKQYYDYSRLVRYNDSFIPSRRLMVVFNYYTVSQNDNGDLYTVNSYDFARFESDIPLLDNGSMRSTDTLDFRPRVSKFNSSNSSPFAFESRNFGASSGNSPSIIVSPNESSTIGYAYYLPRIDKVVLDKSGKVSVIKGNSAKNPSEPVKIDEAMTIALIKLPPYLYNPRDASIQIIDNRRFTMREIGKIEDRVSKLEVLTSLSLLELDTKTLQIQDSDGLSRFKSGFFADSFENTNFIDIENIDANCDVNINTKELNTPIDFYSLKPQLALNPSINIETADFSQDLDLLDPRVVKKGDLITLAYNETGWIEQPLATRTENVNPFNMIEWVGRIIMSPASDSWIRNIYLDSGSRSLLGDSDREYIDTIKISSQPEPFMRSRNVAFVSGGLKPFTRYYSFFDGSSGIDIIPKLLEIQMTSGIFQVGETVNGYIGDKKVISFRLCQSNHKTGAYNNPLTTMSFNPYDRALSVPAAYSSASNILNVDTNSLSEDVLGTFNGYLEVNTVLIGQKSSAQAKVRAIRLVTDAFGDLGGALFLRDPLTTPPPTVRFQTGTKTFKLTSSSSNEIGITGSLFISSAETTYSSSGIIDTFGQTKVVVRRPPPPPPPPPAPPAPPAPAPIIIQQITQQIIQPVTVVNVVRPVTVVNRVVQAPAPEPVRRPRPSPPPPPPPPRRRRRGGKDPLAQSFTVDNSGGFLNSVDLYFASKDENERVTVELRTVELGTPTNQLVQDFASVSLTPDQVNTSRDASIPTRVTFPSPIYLQPSTEYALVILAPSSNNYEMWVGRMGEVTVKTQNLPDAESVVMTRQYLGGSLFKSQNGTIWTASQNEDLKFKLYKCQFVNSGVAYFYNPDLNIDDSNVSRLTSNPIKTYPRKLKVGIVTLTDSPTINSLSVGSKIGQTNSFGPSGFIESIGSEIDSASVFSVGIGYSNGTYTGVPLYSITGSGEGAVATLQFSDNGLSSIVSFEDTGNGYSVGDVLGITTSIVGKGKGASITVSNINGLDTLYLTNAQGELFSAGNNLIKYNENSIVGLAASIRGLSSVINPLYDGRVIEVSNFNHSMHSDTNIVSLSGISPDTSPTLLTQELTSNSTTISVASTLPFATFEGQPSSSGYVVINSEVIYYDSVGDGILGISTRGFGDSVTRNHSKNSLVYPYELNGISLTRINKSHELPNDSYLRSLRDIDTFHIQIDRLERSFGNNQVSFTSEKVCGGNDCLSTRNVQFNSIIPQFNTISPEQTTAITSQIRTVSGTSAGGNEVSFIDQGYEFVELNKQNDLKSTRMVCSKLNEVNRLTSLPRNKSFTVALSLVSSDPNVSPVIDTANSSIVFSRNRLNNPVSNYAYDNRVNANSGDPHAAIYISKKIDLAQPATSLRVFLTSYRHSSADFRVLYKLFRPDSDNIEQNYELFPGYDNLIDINGDGFGDNVIDVALNSGRPDSFVRSSKDNEFLEYQFTADNLDKFTGFVIKIVMSGKDESYAPRFKDLRAIALA